MPHQSGAYPREFLHNVKCLDGLSTKEQLFRVLGSKVVNGIMVAICDGYRGNEFILLFAGIRSYGELPADLDTHGE